MNERDKAIARQINQEIWDRPELVGSDAIFVFHATDKQGKFKKLTIELDHEKKSFEPIRAVFINHTHPQGRMVSVFYGTYDLSPLREQFLHSQVEQIWFEDSNLSPFPLS